MQTRTPNSLNGLARRPVDTALRTLWSVFHTDGDATWLSRPADCSTRPQSAGVRRQVAHRDAARDLQAVGAHRAGRRLGQRWSASRGGGQHLLGDVMAVLGGET